MWKMGKSKKSVVWEFFEQRANGKGFVNSSNLCTFEVKIPDRCNYNFFLEIPVSVSVSVDTNIQVLVLVEILVSTHL